MIRRAPPLTVNTYVEHAIHGRGVIDALARLNKTTYAAVDFNTGHRDTVKVRDLTRVTAAPVVRRSRVS